MQSRCLRFGIYPIGPEFEAVFVSMQLQSHSAFPAPCSKQSYRLSAGETLYALSIFIAS